MNFGNIIKSNVESVKDRVRSYKVERDVNRQFKERTRALKNKLEYEEAKEYLSTRKNDISREKTISLARTEKRKQSFSYKLGQKVKGLQTVNQSGRVRKRPIANVSRGALFSSGHVATGSHDRNVLFGNVDNSILYRNNKRR